MTITPIIFGPGCHSSRTIVHVFDKKKRYVKIYVGVNNFL